VKGDRVLVVIIKHMTDGVSSGATWVLA